MEADNQKKKKDEKFVKFCVSNSFPLDKKKKNAKQDGEAINRTLNFITFVHINYPIVFFEKKTI